MSRLRRALTAGALAVTVAATTATVTATAATAATAARPAPVGVTYDVLVDADHARILLAGSEGMGVFDLGGTLQQVVPGEFNDLDLHDGVLYAAAGTGVRRFDAATLTELPPLARNIPPVYSIAFAGGNIWACVAGAVTRPLLVAIRRNGVLGRAQGSCDQVESAPGAPDSIWTTFSGFRRYTVDGVAARPGAAATVGPRAEVSLSAVSPDGRFAFIVTTNGRLESQTPKFDGQSLEVLREPLFPAAKPTASAVFGAAEGPQGFAAAVRDSRQTQIVVGSFETGSLRTVATPVGGVAAMGASPSGDLVATAGPGAPGGTAQVSVIEVDAPTRS